METLDRIQTWGLCPCAVSGGRTWGLMASKPLPGAHKEAEAGDLQSGLRSHSPGLSDLSEQGPRPWA